MIQAFSNNTKIKDEYITRFKTHVEQGNLIRNSYAKSVNSHWQGSAITCLLNASETPFSRLITDHKRFETEPIQFPEWLGRMIDGLHEKTGSIEFSQKFNLDLLEAIPVGFTDWESVKSKFLSAILQENIERVEKLDILDKLKTKVLAAIQQCKDYQDSQNKTEELRSAAALAARSAMWSAVWSAAYDRYALLLVELFKSY